MESIDTFSVFLERERDFLIQLTTSLLLYLDEHIPYGKLNSHIKTPLK